MRLVPLALAALLGAPVALAGHAVDHDPLRLYEFFPDTCAASLLEENPFADPIPMGPFCDAATFVAEVAGDGYVVLIGRDGDLTFDVRVRHVHNVTTPSSNFVPRTTVNTPVGIPLASLQDPSAFAPEGGRCATSAACGNRGLWFHGDANPLAGAYPDQTIAAVGPTAWRITLNIPAGSLGPGVLVGVVGLSAAPPGNEAGYVRGFYQPAKLAAGLDALDAAPFPTLV